MLQKDAALPQGRGRAAKVTNVRGQQMNVVFCGWLQAACEFLPAINHSA